jgi:hypothetical protein
MEDLPAELDAYEDWMLAGAHGAVFGAGGQLGAELLKRKNSLELDLDLEISPDEAALQRAGEKVARRIAAEMASWRHAGG